MAPRTVCRAETGRHQPPRPRTWHMVVPGLRRARVAAAAPAVVVAAASVSAVTVAVAAPAAAAAAAACSGHTR